MASDQYPEPTSMVVCGVFARILAWLMTWAVLVGRLQMALSLGFGVAIVAVIFLRLACGLAAKRRLTVADRLEVVAELARRGLVSLDEAAELGQRFAQLAPAAAG